MTGQTGRSGLALGIMLGAGTPVHGSGREPLAGFVDDARAAEEAGLDFLLVADNYEFRASRTTGTAPPSPPLEPLTLLSALSRETKRIGLVATISTTFTHPFQTARHLASMDHVSGGRAGWNIVTSAGGEEKFGTSLPAHDDRYRRAAEYVGLVTELWDCWADDALTAGTPPTFRPDRIREVAHDGEFFSVHGALSFPRSPQGHPVLVQAGSSPAGRALASRFAEVVFTPQPTEDGSREMREDLRRGAVAAGRAADDIRLTPGVRPIIGRTHAEAVALADELDEAVDVVRGRAMIEAMMGHIDLSGHDLADPFPVHLLPEAEQVKGRRTRFERLREVALAPGATVLSVLRAEARSGGNWVVPGTVEQVADELAGRFRRGAVDGYILLDGRGDAGLIDHLPDLVAALRDRGVVRGPGAGSTLRERLELPARPNLVRSA
ncbi:NtaA/DmoA family FMN-dependent monooxygenase [Nakamurella sp. YIM 132087]|uniref:NtaA/DmoA family FMN-dependent monooxygenase n=1 Tax=Nakamurella alba TaxID=2665158 RepID=A0A7K1FRD1_9ACTN|nr:NtaA/DmoA family FMN-dependent monooxygenase [Nakamurella alba]MTD16630.1 NtaA/DmoA family FMN-dependent monooxygenase [Nakamurella alba]